MASTWEPYIHLIQNTFNASPGQWSEINVCKEAAIYEINGLKWAASGDFELNNYSHKIATEDGGTKTVEIKEVETLVKRCKGIGPGEGGIMINKVKYTFQSQAEEDGVKFLRLIKGGRGAVVALTTYAVIVGTFD